MRRIGRFRRRADHWTSPHERARVRAAERLDGPLGLAEATWLDEHLAGCAACAAIAASYETDRQALRGLRDRQPEPPRDLWARTATAIERESSARGRSTGTAPRSGSRLPLGALSGIAVIAVVVGVSTISSGLFNDAGGDVAMFGASPTVDPQGGASETDEGATPASSGTPAPTPLAVGAGDVQWVRTDANGVVAFNNAPVSTVCPEDGAADCATLRDIRDKRIGLDATPRTIIGSPTEGQAVVVSDDGSGGEQILVMMLPEDADPVPTTAPSLEPTASDASASPDPGSTEGPVGSASPDPTPDPTPIGTDAPPASASPSPEPTVAASLAIASDIQVVGESAAFSTDGTWFAFTARPTDTDAGPDVWVWLVGDPEARQLTTDGRSHFASWDGNEIVVSRPDDSSQGRVETVIVDPATGEERPAGTTWRPVVDPSGQRAVAWVGTIAFSEDGSETAPTGGRLELRAWTGDGAASGGGVQVVTDVAAGDFDVRWDESGVWFATWIADPASEEIGRLSLYRVDPATGLLASPEGAPVDVPALSGFSIGEGRLAWATPPGQDGEGSRVRVVAWSRDGVGAVETAPGEDLIVVR